MSLKGTAFMVMWHDIDPAGEAEYNKWHTFEHMPERLALPGFLRARRGVDWSSQHQRYLTVYESENLDALRSDEYLKSLNYPTPWTQRMAPHFRNFLRVACETVRSAGSGVGGAISTYRIHRPEGEAAEEWFASDAKRLVEELGRLTGVCGVHIALPRPVYSEIKTTETEIRPKMAEKSFDGLVMLDGVGVDELKAADPNCREILASRGSAIRGDIFAMAFLLGRDGGS